MDKRPKLDNGIGYSFAIVNITIIGQGLTANPPPPPSSHRRQRAGRQNQL